MISCNEYDYIEIVCMHRYPIKITLKTGEVIECTALDTQRNEAREECMKVNIDGTQMNVVLESISKLAIAIENPHFKEVSFHNS